MKTGFKLSEVCEANSQTKSLRLLAGFAVFLVAVIFSFTLAGCDDGTSGGDGGGGGDIPVKTLTAGTWANGNITFNWTGREQWFKFTAIADTHYLHVQFDTLTDLNVQIYASDGDRVGSANFYGTNTYMSLTVTVGQEYYIQVTPYSQVTPVSGSGTYKIAFNMSRDAPSSKPGTDPGGGGSSNPFVGTWNGVDAFSNFLSLNITGTTWECYVSDGVDFKGTYTSSGNMGTMTVTHIQYQNSGWRSAAGYGNGTVGGNTLTVTFVITSEANASRTATLTKQ